jgi:Zn-dependent protease
MVLEYRYRFSFTCCLKTEYISLTKGRGQMKKQTMWWILLMILTKKGAILLKATKMLKALKYTKPLITLITMAISIFVYSFWLSIWFSIGVIVMLFVHELGHVLALKLKGLPASAPVFIPLLGAVVFAPPMEPEEEAFVGYAGPFVGTLGGLALFGIWTLLPDPPELLLLVSYVTLLINLFNLIPIRPLDGGRVTQITGERFKYVGLGILVLLTAFLRDPGLLIIWVLVLQDIPLTVPTRVIVGFGCEIFALVLIYSGFSTQPFWLDVMDIVVMSLINVAYLSDIIGAPPAVSIRRKEVPRAVRLKWAYAYLALVALLIGVMVYQSQLLPEGVKQHHQRHLANRATHSSPNSSFTGPKEIRSPRGRSYF